GGRPGIRHVRGRGGWGSAGPGGPLSRGARAGRTAPRREGPRVDIVSRAVSDSLLAHCTPADDLLRELAAETREAFPEAAGMQVSHDEGELLTMLTRMVGARRAVEVGVFTGYSSICIARGMPGDGHLLACDVSEQYTSLARRYWKRAGLEERIQLPVAPAPD